MTSGASGEVMLAQDEGCPSKVGFLNNILLSYTDIYIYIYIYLCNEINDMYIYIIYYSGKYHILQETTFTRTTFVLARALYTYIYIHIIIIIIIVIVINLVNRELRRKALRAGRSHHTAALPANARGWAAHRASGVTSRLGSATRVSAVDCQ